MIKNKAEEIARKAIIGVCNSLDRKALRVGQAARLLEQAGVKVGDGSGNFAGMAYDGYTEAAYMIGSAYGLERHKHSLADWREKE